MRSATSELDSPLHTRLQIAVVLGVVRMAMGVAADLASGYATGSTGEVVSAYNPPVLVLFVVSTALLWNVVPSTVTTEGPVETVDA